MKLHLDFECFSPASIDAGDYFLHPDFVVTVIAWAWDNGPVKSLVWPKTDFLPPEIVTHLATGGTVCAHNAKFEHAVIVQHYGEVCPMASLDCTMERAFVGGLPGSLGAAGRALGLAIVKDDAEKPLMQAMGKPRTKGLPWHEVDPVRLARLEAYCRQDVEAERALDDALLPLSEFERKVSLLTARSNSKGFLIDVAAVRALQAVVNAELAGLDAELDALTGGAVTAATQRDRLLAWLKAHNCPLPDLKKETVEGALATLTTFQGLHPTAKRVLELRKLAAKSSLAKLPAMLTVVGPDDRARNQIQYYGAGRTGRWAGRMIQPQNLPRPHAKGFDAAQALEVIVREGSVPSIVYDQPLTVVASCLRPCIIAKPGHVLMSIDLSQIEARVTAWLAGQDDLVARFALNEPVYEMAAASVGSSDRQLGKVMILACQYGMGLDGVTFQKQARDQYGLELTLAEASAAVRAYRDTYRKIVRFWWDMLEEAKRALGTVPAKASQGSGVGGVRTVGRVKLRYHNGILRIQKPNGGVLYYHAPWIDGDENFWFMGPVKERGGWVPVRTYGGKFVENISQAVARDIMAEAVVRIERALGLVPVMTVHDEAVYEVPEGYDVTAIEREFNVVPSWAAGLPIASETKCGRRFTK